MSHPYSRIIGAELNREKTMNRAEKEMLKKRTAEREGLSEEECQKLDELNKLVHDVHYELFPEEYDAMMDSIADANDRRRGINPMSLDYTEKVNARRKERGVPPLGANGLPTDDSSWDVAREEALRRLE
jgi:hypothetical protein